MSDDVIDVEVVEQSTTSHGLAVRSAVPDAARAMEEAAAKVALQMELKWEEERKERERWKLEDKRDAFYARLVAQMAAACLAEGAVGVRPKPEHVAELAVSMANAVMVELDKDFKKKQAQAEAAAAHKR